MSSKPIVSVLMTAFNREKYIAEAIESVLSSSLLDFELIVVDDKSTDSTVSIVQEYENVDKRIQLYINDSNLGDYPNRNKAASLARGKYLKYVDSDDKIYPDTLRILVDTMELCEDAALGLTARLSDNKDFSLPLKLSPADAIYQHFMLDGFLENGPLASIIRKDVFDEMGGFSGKRMIGDVELWLSIAAKYPIVRLPGGLVFWRRHEDQEFSKGFKYYLTGSLRMNAEVLGNPALPMEVAARRIAFSERRNAAFKVLTRNVFRLKPLEVIKLYRDLFGIKLNLGT